MNNRLLIGAAFVIVLIGGVNSGLIGLFTVNILGLFGSAIYRLLSILVGISAGYLIYMRFVKKAF
jgi:uncharacterized membrane protein YuzA (DUF378 family)